MRRAILAAVILWGIWLSAQAQETAKGAYLNIVPNASFEQYSSAPIGWFYKGKHFTEVMKYWNSPTGASPDVFGPRVRVPNHWKEKGFGNQKPRKGNSMVGITCYGCTDGKPHCREYVQIQLIEPLVVGQNYYLEMWLSHLPFSLEINGIGAAFAREEVKIPTDNLLDLKPVVVAEEVLSVPNNGWKKLSGRFQAAQTADYMIIGNFLPDSLTKVRPASKNKFNYAYYYVDEVILHKVEPIIEVPLEEDDLSKVVIEEGKVVPLKNIFFETDKYELLPRSFIELNKLLQLMVENPEMVIEIRGHTDIRGTEEYNLYLSRKRAEAVADFLCDHRIDPGRIQYNGYGASLPIATNDTYSGMQLNRRVEFLILKK